MIIVENFNSVSFHRQFNTDESDTNTSIKLEDMIDNSEDCYRIVVTVGSKAYPIVREDPTDHEPAAGEPARAFYNKSEQFIVIVRGWWISRDDGRSYEHIKGRILIDYGCNDVCVS